MKSMETSLQAITKRLSESEESQSQTSNRCSSLESEIKVTKESRAQLEGRLDQLESRIKKESQALLEKIQEERQCREGLEQKEQRCRDTLQQDIHSLQEWSRVSEVAQKQLLENCEASDAALRNVKEQLTQDFQRTSKQLEARVTLAEEKVSECRHEAKDVVQHADSRDEELREIHAQLRKINSTCQHALNSSGQAIGAQRDNSIQSENVEERLRELQATLRAKA